MAMWMVRSGRHGEGDDIALRDGVVGIGWPEAGDLTALSSTDGVRQRLASAYPDAKPSTLSNWVGQVDAFLNRMTVNDLVALPLKTSPAVAFGRVLGGCRYAPEAPGSMRHQRPVTWIREDVPRDSIDQDLRYSLGAFLTVCRIRRNNAEVRFEALLSGTAVTAANDAAEATIEPTDSGPVDFGELARDQLRDRLAARFRGHDLARLVAEVFTAQGLVVDVSPPGPDGGVDILAGEGPMGFDGATLAVQVKSGGVVDAPTLRELQGVMANFGASRGLLVSWGGFTKTARAEARRLFFQIRLWDSDDVIAKIQDIYEDLPADTQTELPLRRIWTLVPDET